MTSDVISSFIFDAKKILDRSELGARSILVRGVGVTTGRLRHGDGGGLMDILSKMLQKVTLECPNTFETSPNRSGIEFPMCLVLQNFSQLLLSSENDNFQFSVHIFFQKRFSMKRTKEGFSGTNL